jgi:site-specific recombinase XerD
LSQALASTLKAWLQEFLADMLRRGQSKASHKVYRCDLLQFVDWVADQAELHHPGDLTVAVLEQYQMHLMLRSSRREKKKARTLSAGSRNRALAELRSFFRYLRKSCKLLSNPALELQRAKEPKRIPKVLLTVPEVGRLLVSIPRKTAVGLRDRAAVEVLYGAGVRRGELLGLNLTDLRLDEGFVHVLGKGQKERVVPLGEAAVKALQAYLKRGRPRLAQVSHQCLWVSCLHGGPVTDRELLISVRKHVRRAGIKKRIGYHTFRHSCATHLLRAGADIRAIQTLLGHSNLNTTAIYTRVDIADLQKTLQQFHPREQDHDPQSP